MSYIKVNEPLNRIKLEDILVEFVHGITNYKENCVRPAYQPISPSLKQGDDICVFHIAYEKEEGIWLPSEKIRSSRSVLSVNFYFYGEDSYTHAREFLNGIWLEHNRYELIKNGLNVMSVGTLYEIPENINEIDFMRHDLKVKFSLVRNIDIDTPTFKEFQDISINNGGTRWH